MAAASKPTRTPFFSEPLLGTDIAALTQADNRAIDELLEEVGTDGQLSKSDLAAVLRMGRRTQPRATGSEPSTPGSALRKQTS
jgi:hypothetical protein